jgi:hypothetical protein
MYKALAIVDALLEMEQDEFDFSAYPDTEFDPKGWSQDNVPYKFPKIKTTFSKITWHEDGDGDPDAYDEEHGYEDEEGDRIEVDEFDREEGLDICAVAAKWLKNKGVSMSASEGADWYSTEPHTDMHTGEITTKSFHLEDFSPDEEARIREILRSGRK